MVILDIKLTTTNAYQPYTFSILNMHHTHHARVAMCEGFREHDPQPMHEQ